MSKGLGITLGVLLVLTIIISGFTVKYFSIVGEAIDIQETCITEKKVVEASLDNMNKQIKQLAQVVGMSNEVFLEFQSMVSDSKKGQAIGGVMSSIQEKYPQYEVKDQHKDLMQKIEIRRTEFFNDQKSYNAKVKSYNSFIRQPMNDFFLSDVEFQRIEPFVVSSAAAQESMRTGQDELETLF